MPKFNELTLDKVLAEVKDDAFIQSHLPELMTPKARHNRKFVLTVISTIKPNYVMALVEHAHNERAKEIP